MFPPVQNLLVVSVRVVKSWKMHMRVDICSLGGLGVFADCGREGSDE